MGPDGKPVPLSKNDNTRLSGISEQPKDIEDIPLNVTGDDFIAEAKKLGIPPQYLDVANRVAQYKDNPNQLYSIKGNQRVIIDRLAHRINPDYDMMKYPAVASAEKNLTSGKVSQSLSSIGRLFDEVEQASSHVDAANNTGSEYVNRAAGATYLSGSQYQQNLARLGTDLNNVVDSASAVAKGGAQGAEGDAKRRSETMNKYQAPETLKAALYTEAEVGLKNGQSSLSAYNTAHGYTPDNPKYRTILDHMTPAQQKKAVKMLGAEKIEEITGKPVPENLKAASIPRVNSEAEARDLIKSGNLKSGDQFIDEHGVQRTVH